jgi:hypothetical protein
MTGKRIRYAALAAMLALLCLCGCSKYKQIRPVSAKVESISPQGFRTVAAVVALEIDNPAGQVTLSEIEGQIVRSGKVFGKVAVDPFILEARSLKTYHLRAEINLGEDVNLLDVMSLLKTNVLEEFTVDLYARATLKAGASKKMAYEGLPLKELYELVR